MNHYDMTLTPRRRVNRLFEPWKKDSVNQAKFANSFRTPHSTSMHHKTFVEALNNNSNSSAHVPRYLLHLPSYLSPRDTSPRKDGPAPQLDSHYRTIDKIRPKTVPAARKPESGLLTSLLNNIDKFVTGEKKDKSRDRFNIGDSGVLATPKMFDVDDYVYMKRRQQLEAANQERRYVKWKDVSPHRDTNSKFPTPRMKNSVNDSCLQTFLGGHETLHHKSVRDIYHKLVEQPTSSGAKRESCDNLGERYHNRVKPSTCSAERVQQKSTCQQSQTDEQLVVQRSAQTIMEQPLPCTYNVPMLNLPPSSPERSTTREPPEEPPRITRGRSKPSLQQVCSRHANLRRIAVDIPTKQLPTRHVTAKLSTSDPTHVRALRSDKKYRPSQLCRVCRIRRCTQDSDESDSRLYSDDETSRRRRLLCRTRRLKHPSNDTFTQAAPSPVSGSKAGNGHNCTGKDKSSENLSVGSLPKSEFKKSTRFKKPHHLRVTQTSESESDDWGVSEDDRCTAPSLAFPRETRTATLLMLDDRGRAAANRTFSKAPSRAPLSTTQTQTTPPKTRRPSKTVISINVNEKNKSSTTTSSSCTSKEFVPTTTGLCPYNLLCDGSNCDHSGSDVTHTPLSNITYPSYKTALNKFRNPTNHPRTLVRSKSDLSMISVYGIIDNKHKKC